MHAHVYIPVVCKADQLPLHLRQRIWLVHEHKDIVRGFNLYGVTLSADTAYTDKWPPLLGILSMCAPLARLIGVSLVALLL